MCGIAGYITNNGSFEYWIEKSQKLLHHRGPDHTNAIYLNDKKLGMSFNRLAILDLSDNANQPMLSNNKDFAMVFNGEIYNFLEVRAKLENCGYSFNSSGDSEVLLYSFIEWGDRCFEELEGMFAFAIYDSKKNEIFLARDRFGEKPLYYLADDQGFFFSSQIKVLLELSSKNDISTHQLNHYLHWGFAEGDASIINGIKKLEAGSFIKYHPEEKRLEISKYSEPENLTKHSNKNVTYDLVSQLETILEASILNRLESDVPIGFMLSGGLDSSIITTIASRHVKDINSYTVIFPESSHFNESQYAKKIAAFCKSQHQEINGHEIQPSLLEEVVTFFDEPLSDPSLLPTYILCRAISNYCKVAIGGDGADELFGGYPHYKRFMQLENFDRVLPSIVKKNMTSTLNNFFPSGKKGSNTIELFSQNFTENYYNFSSFFNTTNRQKLLAPYFRHLSPKLLPESIQGRDLPSRMSYSDFKIWLVEDILVKIDRASMANSLEMRSPFLDSTVVDFALNYVPGKLKATSYSNKSILKELGKKILPKEFDIQRKQGFCLPIDELFRSDLWGDYFKANLNSLNSDLLNKKAALDILNQHHNGYIHGNRLFCILIFMVWLNKYQDVLQ